MEILDFIQELENAAMQDGAQAEDIFTQISSFITNQNILREIKDMSGKIRNDWELLKYQMVQRWGKMMPLMKFTRENLENLHCQKIWLGWLHPILYWMRPSDSNSGARHRVNR
ncbi:hypothetical protein PCASD_22452 [Puccinia coronata f. sp. avenae]|uniref:Uncharacterized protein n=1 Tax=Puccinia coronata f. sp. avenae TaxID=200324 RepID=A0A2N5TSQ5_9BASI|nr:hypothetical protein PCASD_22452 [Puccinia coronata f. sp. avenae]